MTHTQKIFICALLYGLILDIIHCDYNSKQRILFRSELLQFSQVEKLAEKYGLKILNKIERYANAYILIPRKDSSQSLTKRDFIPNIEKIKFEPMVDDVTIENWEIRDPRGTVRSTNNYNNNNNNNDENNNQSFVKQISDFSVINIRDPDFNKQWYLYNTGMILPQYTMDINVLPVWNRGINGRGVTIAVLDDGIDYTNADIYSNYDRYASYDYQDMDEDPSPSVGDETSHGTRCASIIAGSNNNFCGVGIAYNASIAGIRMLDNKTTDTIEADALSHKSDRIDIYSCNWGPRDDGSRFGGPGPLAAKALHLGALKGRNQLGSIYIWSSGNGGLEGDNCNADGYVTNLYTLAIGAISADGHVPLYAETCSSVLAVTFSGSMQKESVDNLIINSDIGNQCKSDFQGTSSAGSIATGMVALMLQANPSLSWRDVHHIIVETAQIVNPGDGEWKRNGAGKWFNPKYGFGRLDAFEMVQSAYEWKGVDTKQMKCKIPYEKDKNKYYLYQGGSLMLNLNSTNCYYKGKSKKTVIERNTIKKVEHVQLIVTLSHECRGRMDLRLISPGGTISSIMKPRPKDKSSKGLQEWIFKSVHFWGESPVGQWTLVFSDSVHVDPCHMNNHTSNLTSSINNNKTEPLLKNNITNAITTIGNNNTTVSGNHTNNGSSLVRTQIDNLTSTTPTPANNMSDPTDIKMLYNIVSNINDVSQKILKLQNNNNTNEEKTASLADSSKTGPTSTKTLQNEGEQLEDESSFSEKLKPHLDDSNNNTKYYERILLEKVRVGPDSAKNTVSNHSSVREYIKNENELEDDENQLASLSSDKDNAEDEVEVSGTNEQKPRRTLASTPLNKFYSKKEYIPGELQKEKRSKAYSPKKFYKNGLKLSKIKKSLKIPKLHTERKRIVGKFHSFTLTIYGT